MKLHKLKTAMKLAETIYSLSPDSQTKIGDLEISVSQLGEYTRIDLSPKETN